MPFKSIINKKGFVALFVTILVLVMMFGIAMSIAVITLGAELISSNIVKSTQAYYAAEAGLEDAILRLKEKMNVPSAYVFGTGNGISSVSVSDIIGGSRTIEGQGDFFGRIRKVRIVYAIDASEISFYYGAQVGDGGMVMGNNSRIKGNLFSNGNVIASAGKGYIDNNVIVAKNGNKIRGLEVGQEALVHTCEESVIGGDLTYVSGGSVVNCPAGGLVKSRPNEIDPMPFPVSQQQIQLWKEDAGNGGILNYDVLFDGSSADFGPVQVGTETDPKNLTIDNNSHLYVSGTIYVTGNIIFNNNSIIELDQDCYGSLGGVIIADGNIVLSNGAIIKGSGQPGSYILVLSTSSSLDSGNPAILVSNNSQGAIFYAGQGLIYLNNNMEAREITAYKVQINNNAEIEYESGLESALFTSGSGGSWKVDNWKEIE